MNTIKSSLLLLLACCLLLACKSQQHITKDLNVSSRSYAGTWHYQNGDRLFIVKIWQDGEEFLGHYKMVEVNNGIPGAIIYNSRHLYANGQIFPFGITTTYVNNFGLSGFIYDNTIANNDEDYKSGNLQICINQFLPGCQNCSVTATWKVFKETGMIVGTNYPFSVPTDITLTKVSDTVVWD
jgi:hypothetical protein